MTKNAAVQNAIRSLRSSLGYSQEALARALDLSWRTVARYEGDSPPSGAALIRLIDFAEKQQCDQVAVALRQAYVSDMKGEGLQFVFDAFVRINTSIEKLQQLAKSQSEFVNRSELEAIVRDLDAALQLLVKVFPTNPETGSLEWEKE